MLSLRTWRNSLVAAVMLAVVAATIPIAWAGVIQPTPSLPPTSGAYTTGTLCVSLGPGVCIVGASLHGFTGTTSTFDNSGQLIDSSISLTADVYTDVSGMPGTLIGPVLLQGPIGILYANRMTDMDLGTFTSSLTELDLMGMFNGHSIEIILNPMVTSSGPTTVAPSGSDFQVSSFFDVFTEISVNGVSAGPGPERTFTLTPEPGSLSLLAVGLLGVAGELRRRTRR